MKNIFFISTHFLVAISMFSQSLVYAAPNAESIPPQPEAITSEAVHEADQSLLYTFRTEPQKILTSSEAFIAVGRSLQRDFIKKSNLINTLLESTALSSFPDSNITTNFRNQKTQVLEAIKNAQEGLAADVSNMEKLYSRGVDFKNVHPELSTMITQRLFVFDKILHTSTVFSQISQDSINRSQLMHMDYQTAQSRIQSLNSGAGSSITQEERTLFKLTKAEALSLLNALEENISNLSELQKSQNGFSALSKSSESLLLAVENQTKKIKDAIIKKYEAHNTLLYLIFLQEYISYILNESSASIQKVAAESSLDSKFLDKISDALRVSLFDTLLNLPENLFKDAKKLFSSTANFFNEFLQVLIKRSVSESEIFTSLKNTAEKTYEVLKNYFLEIEKTNTLLTEKNSPETLKKFEGKDFWSTIESLLINLRGSGYVPYHDNNSTSDSTESKLIEPLEVMLTTPGLSDVISITDADVETLAKKNWFQTYVTSSAKNLVVHLKPSSVSKTESKVGTVEVRTEVDPQLQKKKMLIDVVSQDNEKVSFEYVLDPDMAVKTYVPLLREALITRDQAKGAVISTIQRFPFEMIPFNAGVLVNSWLNLLTRYENDPKAVERVVAEWLSFPGMMSFIGFMMGNQFSSIMMNQVARGKLSKQMVPFLSMGFGALFSNIAGDLLAITKPCADAMMKRDDLNPGDVSRICEEGFTSVVNSDLIHRYIQTSITVTASSTLLGLGTNLLKMGIEKSAQKSLAINGLVGITSVAVQKLSRLGWHFPKIASLNPISLGISTLHLVAFFQTDHLINPYIHKMEETFLNSGSNFALANNRLKRAFANLKERGFQNYCDLQKDSDSPVHRRHAMTSDSPGAAFEYSKSCEALPLLMKDYEKAATKWSDTLQYEFNMAFYSWQEFFSEFISQRDIAQRFYSSLLLYLHSKNDTTTYNPMFENDPLYGVIPVVADVENQDDDSSTELTERPQKILIEKTFLQLEEEFFVDKADTPERMLPFINKQKYNEARIQRLRQAAFIINEDINNIRSVMSSGKYINTNTFESYIARLEKIKTLILDKGILNEDYSKVEEGLLLVKDTFESYKNHTTKVLASRYAGGHPGGIGPVFANGESSPISKSIRDIYNFIGRPKPLKAGEGFLIRFNDWVIANYGLSSQISSQVAEIESLAKNTSQYINGVLFPNALTEITTRHGDTPAETMLYHAMCGLDLSNPIQNFKKRIQNEAEAARGIEVQKNANLLESRKVLFGLLESGTGMDFIVPKLIDSRVSDPTGVVYATENGTKKIIDTDSICRRGKAYYSESIQAMVPSSMSSEDFDSTTGQYTVRGKEGQRKNYSNTLEFVVDAVSSEIYDRANLNIAQWWSNNVLPAIDDAFLYYEQAYFSLIDTKFKDSLFGSQELPKTTEDIEALIKNNQLEKTFKSLPNTQAGVWVSQIDLYLNSLVTTYTQLQQKEIAKLKLSTVLNSSEKEKIDFEIQVRTDDIKRFSHNATALKMHGIFMMSDLAAAMNGATSSNPQSKTPRSEGFDLSNIFGPALGYLYNMMQGMGLKVDFSPEGLNYYSFLHEVLQFESKYQIAPTSNAGTAIQAMLMSSPDLSGKFNSLAQEISGNEEYKSYLGLFSNIVLAPQAINNPSAAISSQERNEIELAYMATTQLFTVFNEIYNKTTIFKAASSKNTFQEFNLEQLDQKRKGTAGSMNR